MGGLITNSWLTKGSILVVIRTLRESRERLRGACLCAMSTSAGTLCIRSTICGQKTLLFGKGALLVACSLALDIEYDTQLHFSIVKDGILVGVQEVSDVSRVIEIPLYIRSKFLPINQYMKNEINLFPCDLWFLSNALPCFIRVQFSLSNISLACDRQLKMQPLRPD